MSHAKGGQASNQANTRRPGRCRRRERTSPIQGTQRADQFSGHTPTTNTSLRHRYSDPVDAHIHNQCSRHDTHSRQGVVVRPAMARRSPWQLQSVGEAESFFGGSPLRHHVWAQSLSHDNDGYRRPGSTASQNKYQLKTRHDALKTGGRQPKRHGEEGAEGSGVSLDGPRLPS